MRRGRRGFEPGDAVTLLGTEGEIDDRRAGDCARGRDDFVQRVVRDQRAGEAGVRGVGRTKTNHALRAIGVCSGGSSAWRGAISERDGRRRGGQGCPGVRRDGGSGRDEGRPCGVAKALRRRPFVLYGSERSSGIPGSRHCDSRNSGAPGARTAANRAPMGRRFAGRISLAPDLAMMATSYHEVQVRATGETVDERGFFTGLAELRDGRWQFRNAHWSSPNTGPIVSPLQRCRRKRLLYKASAG